MESGRQKPIPFTAPSKLIEKFDEDVVSFLSGSGVKVNRSLLIRQLMSLLMASHQYIEIEEIVDESSLRNELAKSIARYVEESL